MRFTGRHALVALSAAVLVAIAVPAVAQTPTLGEIAKKEQERRKGTPDPGKVYTNDDLKGGGLPSAPPSTDPHAAADAPQSGQPDASQPAAAGTQGTAQKDGKPAADAAGKDAEDKEGSDEKAWRVRITDARDEVRRNEVFAEALQSRINALTADFSARDNPLERAKIADDRQKALAELDRVKAEIEKGNKKVADIEEEARKAGVPPGWLR
jgi:hypothetical protein